MKKIAILMADLTGYTALTEVHGAATAAGMIKKYVDLVYKSLAGDSYMLERIGDQVVIVATNADDIAATALALYERAQQENHFLPVHAGMHYGEVLELQGHFYGSCINLTARIAAKAKKGMILCSKDFVDALSNPPLHFVAHGEFQFKNILESKKVFKLLPEFSAALKQKHIDPVCNMQLDDAEREFSHLHKNKTYYFCSQQCKHLFQSRLQKILVLPKIQPAYGNKTEVFYHK